MHNKFIHERLLLFRILWQSSNKDSGTQHMTYCFSNTINHSE